MNVVMATQNSHSSHERFRPEMGGRCGKLQIINSKERADIMRKNKHLTFQFFENEADAVEFENGLKASERGSVTPWTSQDGAEHKTVAWYYY